MLSKMLIDRAPSGVMEPRELDVATQNGVNLRAAYSLSRSV